MYCSHPLSGHIKLAARINFTVPRADVPKETPSFSKHIAGTGFFINLKINLYIRFQTRTSKKTAATSTTTTIIIILTTKQHNV